MKSIFKRDENGLYAYQDPAGDLIYGVPSWIAGATFVSAIWTITDAGSPSPSIHSQQINSQVVTVDDTDYAVGAVALAGIRGLTIGMTYTVNVTGSFSTGETDARSFRLIGKKL